MTLRNRYTQGELDQAIEDYTEWYVSNSNRMGEDTSSSLAQQARFLKLAVDGSLYLIHMLRDELRQVQQQKLTESMLWLPQDFSRWNR